MINSNILKKSSFITFYLTSCLLLLACANDSKYRYKLEASLSSYLNDQTLFDTFAQDYSAYIEEALKVSGLTKDQKRLLQTSRVHLAISYGDSEKALAAAQALKEMQSDPKAKAMTGLLTKAIVAAQEKSPGELWSSYMIEAFQQQYAAELALVSPGPSVGELQAMSQKFEDMDTSELVNEFLAEFHKSVDASNELDLKAADALVRVRHKALNVLPIKIAIQRAIAEQIYFLKSSE